MVVTTKYTMKKDLTKKRKREKMQPALWPMIMLAGAELLLLRLSGQHH